MKNEFLDFCRIKIDFFDSQLLFFIKERIICCKNLKEAEVQKAFQDSLWKQNISSTESFIKREWFLDFLSFDYTKENLCYSKEISKEFALSYLLSIDANIYFLLHSRFLISLQIGLYKKQHQLKIVDYERWQSLLQNRQLHAKKLNLSKKLVLSLMEKIHQYSVQLQNKDYG